MIFTSVRTRKGQEGAQVEASDKTSLETNNAHTLLAHSLREKTKDDDLVCSDITMKKKDVQVSNNVGLIAAGLRNKQMRINNG